MELNEIKKYFYIKNPTAHLEQVSKNGILYSCLIPIDGINCERILFDIPLNDLGDAEFTLHEPAKHLIRWIVK